MACFDASYFFSFTPSTIVISSPFAGAEIITFFAPPSMCFRAALASVNRPVDSSTMSTPRSRHGSRAGSFSASTLISSSSTMIDPLRTPTSPLYVRWTESYLKRCASVFVSVRSFTATKSMSPFPCSFAARTTCRPMRPKPLMPTRMAIRFSPLLEPVADRRRSTECHVTDDAGAGFM